MHFHLRKGWGLSIKKSSSKRRRGYKLVQLENGIALELQFLFWIRAKSDLIQKLRSLTGRYELLEHIQIGLVLGRTDLDFIPRHINCGRRGSLGDRSLNSLERFPPETVRVKKRGAGH